MKAKLSRKEVQEEIDVFFSKKAKLDSKYVRKIKRLAMKHNIKLGSYRKRFCKKCYSDLRKSKSSVSKGFRNTICSECGFKSRWKIKTS